MEGYIRSHKTLGLYKLGGETPEMHLKRETVGISEFAKFAWYNCILYLDGEISFPEDEMVLGKYLGLSEGVGPTMTAKILRPTGKVVYWPTF